MNCDIINNNHSLKRNSRLIYNHALMMFLGGSNFCGFCGYSSCTKIQMPHKYPQKVCQLIVLVHFPFIHFITHDDIVKSFCACSGLPKK